MDSETRPAASPRGALPTHLTLLAAAILAIGACSGGVTAAGSTPADTAAAVPMASIAPIAAASAAAVAGDTITLYTSVTQDTVDAVTEAWTAAKPGMDVEVFRAPTGEVAARIATELETGGIQADVLWLSDPLSIAGYADRGLLQAWEPASAAGIDPAYRTDTSFGTRLLNMVMVAGTDVTPAPADWSDLVKPDYRDAVAIPDPGFAGSAFAALGYLSQADGYGTAFYDALKADGTTQVKTPDEVITGVAEGRFKAGMTLDNPARTAIAKGSPIQMIWPESGSIAIYSPIAVVAESEARPAAESFVDFTLSAPGQTAIAATGWQPITGSGGPVPAGSQVRPDWAAMIGSQQQLLDAYRAIFGG